MNYRSILQKQSGKNPPGYHDTEKSSGIRRSMALKLRFFAFNETQHTSELGKIQTIM